MRLCVPFFKSSTVMFDLSVSILFTQSPNRKLIQYNFSALEGRTFRDHYRQGSVFPGYLPIVGKQESSPAYHPGHHCLQLLPIKEPPTILSK